MRWLILISLLIVSCKQEEPVTNTVYIEDTSKLSLIKDFFNLKNEIGNTYTQDTMVARELELKSRMIDTLIQKSLNYKENTIDLLCLQREYDIILAEKTKLVSDGRAYQSENQALKLNNLSLKKALEAEKQFSTQLMGEKNNLYKVVLKASDVVISEVMVKGYGYNKSLFSSTKLVYTNRMSKIKGFEISFIVPANPIAEHQNKDINVSIYSTDHKRSTVKDTVISYVGEKIPIKLMMPVEDLAIGAHDIIIFVNSEAQYNSSFLVIE